MGTVTQIQMVEAHQIQTLTLDQMEILIMLLLEHERSLLNTKQTETVLIHSLVLRLLMKNKSKQLISPRRNIEEQLTTKNKELRKNMLLKELNLRQMLENPNKDRKFQV